MNRSTLLNLKRKATQITNEDDIIPNDCNIDLCRKIFLHHYGKEYEEKELSLYQTEKYVHPKYPNIWVEPDFVRDDGVIIYFSLMQNNVYLRRTDEETVQLAMEILKLKSSYIYTITLDPTYHKEEMGNMIANIYTKILETSYKYSPQLVKNYLSTLSSKRRKLDDNNSNKQPTNNIPQQQQQKPVVGFVYNDWVAASKTRNYALNDPLLDWLDHWYDKSGEKNNFKHKVNNLNHDYNFGRFLMNKGTEFESNIIKIIEEKFGKNFVTICRNPRNFVNNISTYETSTINEMMKGTPIIYQGLLMNRSGNLCYSYGFPDLLVRSDYLDKIVETNPLEGTNLKNYKAPNLKGNYHYVVVDIKFTTLELCVDGKRLRNSGSVPAYKCQLYIYNHAVGLIQGYEPTESYILGRKYKYESKGIIYSKNDCFSRFGHIEYNSWDRGYIDEAISAVRWIKKLKNEGKEWKLLPKPSVPELYPNMSNIYESQWDNFKNEYANTIGEITLLWNCGVKNREIAHANGIYSFTDPRCSSLMVGIKGPKQAPILDEIIKINQQSSFHSAIDHVKINLNKNIDNVWLDPYKLRISVDFETVNNIFDDFTTLPVAQDQNYLFMIGVGFQIPNKSVEYKVFLATELSKDAEFQMIYQFYKFLRQITDIYEGKNHSIPPIYHWGHIERSFFGGLCGRLVNKFGADIEEDIALMKEELNWFDLSECFKGNPIVINGCFKFGLKEVAGRLSELGLIKSSWSGNSACTNGNTAMIMAQKAYHESKKKGIPINYSMVIKEIMDYNKIDCIVIHEIIDFLHKKINQNNINE